MKLSKTSFALIAALIAATAGAQEPTGIQAKRGEEPSIGTPTAAEVGDTLYSKFSYTETTGIELDQTLVDKLLSRKINIPAGTFLWRYDGKRETSYCAYSSLVSGLWHQDSMICFRDNNHDHRLDELHIPGTAFGGWSQTDSPVTFHESTQITEGVGYRYELLYEGAAAGALHLSYREFVNDFARPSFTQELSYTIEPSGPTMVVFRGARIQVDKVSNEAIHYQVLAGMRDRK